MRLAPVVLEGSTVRLEPLDPRHFDAVLEATRAHPEIWTHSLSRLRDRAEVERLFALAAEAHADGSSLFFATCLRGPGARVVGSTSIRVVEPGTPSVEIGRTWLVPSAQRTGVNTEAKYLQLSHAFETLGAARVELKTDALNMRSRAAIQRIGATEEGTFRRHLRRDDGTLRDSVFFSIVADEWPLVKRSLEAMMAART